MKEMLLEGAVAGHMNHIYDNGEMSFGELKQLLQAAADGKLRGTEKTDGQNIFLSFDIKSKRAKAARNKGQLAQIGLTAEEVDQFFSEHANQALRFSFVQATEAFEEVVSQFDEDKHEQIFGPFYEVGHDPEKFTPPFYAFYNIEVMNPSTTNVISYDKKTLLIHRVGHSLFEAGTGKQVEDSKKRPIDISEKFELLENAIQKNSIEFGEDEFSVETNPIRSLDPIKDKSILNKTVSSVDNLMSDIRMNDMNTINDYVIAQIMPEINRFGLPEDLNKLTYKRMMKLGHPSKDDPPPSIPSIVRGMPQQLKREVSNYITSFKYSFYTQNLELVLHDFSVAMIDGLESFFIADNRKAISSLRSMASDYKKDIENSSNEAAKGALNKQWGKLKDVENINTPSEGFVFTFNGVTYKFTGAFAPLNQIIGIRKYGRHGPIDPAEASAELPQDIGPSRIAIIPGAFKPPHRGHLAMAETVGADSDKIIIIVSRPLKEGRRLPGGQEITGDHAEQIWRAFLDSSPIANKAVVVQSPAASPIGVTYDFVMKEPEEGNDLIAPPGSIISLGCGDKEDDKSRYLSIAEKARKDLKVEIKVCDLVSKHSPEYLEYLEANPAFLKAMPSNKKTTVDIADFHASDMRFVIDAATKDPIGIELLKDFVPQPEDAYAVMGILGLNPADKISAESDQVIEPEIDEERLAEIVFFEAARHIRENFKKQYSGPGEKSKDSFQVKMKKRLSRAHSFYLDQGNGPRGHHGGGFRLPRTPNTSNAFLAEEEIAEMTAMASGAVAGAPSISPKKRKERVMKEEDILRKKIRIALKHFFDNKREGVSEGVTSLMEEHKLRIKLRNLIFETATEDPTVDVHDNTGINTLKDLMKNSNVLSTLRNVYKTLTTDRDQKHSFRAHIIKWIQDTLAPVRLNDAESGNAEEDSLALDTLSEEMGIDIAGVDATTGPNDLGKMIDADDGSSKDLQQPEEEENEMQSIEGEDTTGRNKAERVYPTIEKSVIDYYAELDNDTDQEMFYDYLIANVKLYFDKWDSEMSAKIKEPTNNEYEQAKQAI